MKNNKIFFITGNQHKFKEIKEIFDKEFKNVILECKNLNPVEIQSDDLKEVALFKLKSVKDAINETYFIEDAGFFIDHPLNGFPGVFSSYVYKKIGNQGILKLMKEHVDSKARFMAVIALYFKPQEKIHFFIGEVWGKVSTEIRGKHGFGYDPIFIPNARPEKTFGELKSEEKNELSHRSMAVKKLINFLKKEGVN